MVSIKYLFQKHKKRKSYRPQTLKWWCVCFPFVFRGLTDNNETAWESVKIFILAELTISLAVGNSISTTDD